MLRVPATTVAGIFVAWLSACDDSAVGDGEADEDPTREYVDLDPDPAVRRISIVAASGNVEILPGKTTPVWGYRDGGQPGSTVSIPGPVLRAVRGEMLEIELTNELDVDTTIHWHGLRLPASEDGTPAAQIPIAPGERYTYRFEAVDAGTFWYHPHVDSDVQIERGLYGAFVVEDPDAPQVDADRVFVLDDIKLLADGTPSEETTALDLMLGRQGNVLLVDGLQRPRIRAAAGAVERWRFVNAANGRYFHLRLGAQPWRVIATDGGPLPAAFESDTLLVAPGERYDVLVAIDAEPGDTLTLETIHYDRGHDIPDSGPAALAELVVGAPLDQPTRMPEIVADLVAIEVDDSSPVRELRLGEDDSDALAPVFFINDRSFPDHEPLEARRGAVEIWDITNETEMDHPFHVHGMFFQALDADGRADARVGNKDTINVPRDATVRLAIELTNPGEWMAHCHILEHAERGMMTMLHVAP